MLIYELNLVHSLCQKGLKNVSVQVHRGGRINLPKNEKVGKTRITAPTGQETQQISDLFSDKIKPQRNLVNLNLYNYREVRTQMQCLVAKTKQQHLLGSDILRHQIYV